MCITHVRVQVPPRAPTKKDIRKDVFFLLLRIKRSAGFCEGGLGDRLTSFFPSWPAMCPRSAPRSETRWKPHTNRITDKALLLMRINSCDSGFSDLAEAQKRPGGVRLFPLYHCKPQDAREKWDFATISPCFYILTAKFMEILTFQHIDTRPAAA